MVDPSALSNALCRHDMGFFIANSIFPFVYKKIKFKSLDDDATFSSSSSFFIYSIFLLFFI